ncbi:hypothetical protein [Alkalihalobacterium elongatum]|uniref:hypothetical protein n=1 Tax=Alkalihalobacterium elongatum TaxID=2675466 RepID=UPI001C1F760F|nr:hypothetical protein [Alkalihalobacterium elongatum]
MISKFKIVLVVLCVNLLIVGCSLKKTNVTVIGEGQYGKIEGQYTITNNFINDNILLEYTGEDELIAITLQAENPISLEILNFQFHIGTINNQTGTIEGKKANSGYEPEDIIQIINQTEMTVEWETATEVYEEVIQLTTE